MCGEDERDGTAFGSALSTPSTSVQISIAALERRADNRGAVVRTVPPDRRCAAVPGGADETGDDRQRAIRLLPQGPEIAADRPPRARDVHVRARELLVGHDTGARRQTRASGIG